MATNALVNQVALEGVVSGNPSARVSQFVAEVLESGIPTAKISQIVAEAIVPTHASVEVNQLVTEVLIPFVPTVTQVLGGFALIASVVNTPDALTPEVTIAVPEGSTLGQTTAFYWSAVGVTSYRITGTNGYDSGILSASEASGVLYVPPFSSSGAYQFTINGLNASNTAVVSVTIALTIAP